MLETFAYHKDNHLTDQRVNDMVLAAIELSWGAIRAHKEHMRMIFESILRDGVGTGEFESIDPRETSRLLMLSLVQFCHPVLVAQSLQDREDPEADARATVRFLLRAITPEADPCLPPTPPAYRPAQIVTITQFRHLSHPRDSKE